MPEIAPEVLSFSQKRIKEALEIIKDQMNDGDWTETHPESQPENAELVIMKAIVLKDKLVHLKVKFGVRIAELE